jgi:hypothetical protein
MVWYTGDDLTTYNQGDKFVPMQRFTLPYERSVPVEEEEKITAQSYGIPNTNAFINSGGGGGKELGLTYNPRAVAEVPVDESIKMEGIEYVDDYGSGVEYPNKIINETIGMHPKIYEPKKGLAKIWDMATGMFKSTPRVRGTLGTRLANQPRIPLPAALAAYSFSPFNPKSRNYNPMFEHQLNMLEMQGAPAGMIGMGPAGHLVYGPDSVLAGKNVISMFGSNDYEEALEKQKAWFENRINQGKKISWKTYQDLINEEGLLEDKQKNIDDKDKSVAQTIRPQHHADVSGGGVRGKGGQGDYTTPSIRSEKAEGIDTKGSGMHGGRHYAIGGRVYLNLGGLASIL